MKGVVCLLMLLHLIADTVQDSCSTSQQGNIRIFGPAAPNLIAGRLEICASGRWRAVYDESWSMREAVIVCIGKGFPAEGARACSSSCFGSSSLEQGYTGFRTCDTTTDLLSCGEIAKDGHSPDNNAGVICTKPLPTPPPSTPCPDTTPCPQPAPCPGTDCTTCQTDCPDVDCSSCPITDTKTCPTCPPDPSSKSEDVPAISCPLCPEKSCDAPATPPILDEVKAPPTTDISKDQDAITGEVDAVEEQRDGKTCTVITAFLGALSALLLIILAGGAMGWVWSCHRIWGNHMEKRTTETAHDAAMENPTYDSVLPSQYSALGPRDTPTSHSPSPAAPQSQGGEEETPYEVPIKAQNTENQGADYEVPTITLASVNRDAPVHSAVPVHSAGPAHVVQIRSPAPVVPIRYAAVSAKNKSASYNVLQHR